jgi:hypothetical protein
MDGQLNEFLLQPKYMVVSHPHPCFVCCGQLMLPTEVHALSPPLSHPPNTIAHNMHENHVDMERYSHKGYLIRVVVIGLSREGHSRALPYSIMV